MSDRRQLRANRQTIAWFKDLQRRDLIDIDPIYQRRSVWSNRYREDFVETVLLGYPAPSIFLYSETDEDGTTRYAVVDGKQRLTTVFEFADDAFPTRDSAPVALAENQQGKYFKDLAREDKDVFWAYEFTVEYVQSTTEAYLSQVFDRINRNVAKLTPQELRHAKYSGTFASAIEQIADGMRDLYDAGFPRIVESSRRQMKDIEFAALLALLVEQGPENTSQAALDEIYAAREEDWEGEGSVVAAVDIDLSYVRNLLEAVPDLASSRLRNQGDFYALFGAVDELRSADALPDHGPAAQRVLAFAQTITEEGIEDGNSNSRRYYDAARSAANDKRQREIRISLLKGELAGEA